MAAPKKKVSAVKDSLKEQLRRLKRELDVEVALERVRVRATAMRSSDELAETSSVLFHQLKKIKINAIRTSVGIFDDPNDAIELWITAISDKREVIETLNYVNLHVHPVFENLIPARKLKKSYALTKLTGKAIKAYYQHLSLPDQRKYNDTEFFYSFFFSQGTLNVVTEKSLTDEQCTILVRFASVFGLIYTRFLDLQRAEAQAREAQIELALERVRKRTMTMNKSGELSEVAGLLYEELHGLGLSQFLNCGYVEVDEKNQIQNAWMTNATGTGMNRVQLPLTGDPVFDERYEAWKRKEKLFHQSIGGAVLKSHIEYGTQHYRQSAIDQLVRTRFPDPTVFYCSNFSNGYLHMITSDSLSEENETLLVRFTGAFELTYKRFLDLKNAEAQAREAQIETAVERVRSRSMAMHRSEELTEVIKAVYEQLILLKIKLDHAGFVVDYTPGGDWHFWIADEQDIPSRISHPHFDSIWANQFKEAKATHRDYFVTNLTFEEKNTFYRELLSHVPGLSDASKNYYMSCPGLAATTVLFKDVSLYIENFSGTPYTDEENKILHRFGNVFQQSYTRFLDLQKAETQAREAQIEAALERVRAQTMAMHNSDDIGKCIVKMFAELTALGLDEATRFGIGILRKDTETITLWTTVKQGDEVSLHIGNLNMTWHPLLRSARKAWEEQAPLHRYVLEGEDLVNYYQMINNAPGYTFRVAIEKLPPREFHYGFIFEHGFFYAFSYKEFQSELFRITQRFSSLFGQTYRRYLDLVKAEAQTQEALKQTSLDRVRAEIASMRTTTDLQRITPLVWRELKTLGVPFFRCGVLIVDDPDQKLNYYLSTPEGRPLAVLHLDFNTEITVVRKVLEHWRGQTTYIDHWTRDQFLAFAQAMIRLGQVETIKSYQGGEQTPESITLQFAPFAQGMLYVGSVEDLTAEQIDLVQALADAFSTAYARYEDFVQLEVAKEKVESTLSDLRATQNQLIQSEKMASLGELTAGIAHEIQNPLNFVNNFSEVSKELLDEMKTELAGGNWKPAAEIADNVIQNLEKINFHGKRADGIVKSMLQHSRKSSGQKELTDINELCDEYLRLAYHGLRAKDKSFNAKFETQFDPGVGKIEIMPQEIGRVVLNLINNAFYAVTEKKETNPANYEPTVKVTTTKSVTNVVISVIDNGNGIPERIKDKIFQPFFTTKPTGQGTGLGLSLSYDIVTKGHGGSLSVETKEGEGTTFLIQLPV